MTDLLTPEKVREFQFDLGPPAGYGRVGRLCRDYLTLWDELEHERELHDKAVKRVAELEQEIGALTR